MNHADQSVASYACPTCKQPPRQSCRTASGKRASNTHVARWRPLADSWADGYEAGERAAQPVAWYDLVRQHQVEAVLPMSNQVLCSCGAQCRDEDGGHPGHIVDVMHEHDMVVARLA